MPLIRRYDEPNFAAGLWYAPDAISHIRNGPDCANANPKSTDGSGPAWVASLDFTQLPLPFPGTNGAQPAGYFRAGCDRRAVDDDD